MAIFDKWESAETPTEPEKFKPVYDSWEPAGPSRATGALQHIQAGWQGSAPGLAWRRKLPDLVMDPEHSSWWERALTGITHVGAELPVMIPAGMAGTVGGAAAGAAITGPAAPVGGVVGGILGGGAAMFGAPAAIRESLMAAYQSGEITTSDEFWSIVQEVAKKTAAEAALGAVTMGAGAVAARTVGKAIAPAIGTSIGVSGATKAIGGADVAAQIGTMVSLPHAMKGTLPDWQEFMDAAIVIGGLKAAHTIGTRIQDTYRATGKTPLEVITDAKNNPEIARDLTREVSRETIQEPVTIAAELSRNTERLTELEAREKPPELPGAEPLRLTPEEITERDALRKQVAKLEAQIKFASDSEASGQRVHDDVLRQITELEAARSAAGLKPIYDRPPTEIAALVRAEVETFASEFRKLPEEIYKERYVRLINAAEGEAVQGELFQGRPFYSELSRQVSISKQESAPAEQWKGMIKNMRGVKPEEVEAVGLHEWLDLQPGKVTKQQISEFLAQNGVKVEETTLGNIQTELPAGWIVRKAESGFDWSVIDANGAVVGHGLTREQATNNVLAEAGQPKFSQWQLPGGENYRELLLTLPGKNTGLPNGYTTKEIGGGFVLRVLAPNGDNVVDLPIRDWSRVETLAEAEKRARAHAESRSSFRSSHFDQPNIVAHVRFNERTDADGKRVLFVEEIQSDWAQKGKKEGFQKASGEITDAERTAAKDYFEVRQGYWDSIDISERNQYVMDMREREAKRGKNVVPSAPFVGKTEAWVALAIKRMIRYAADNGFDRIAWTTGEQQAARYDLSKHISEVHYSGTNLKAYDHKGKTVIEQTGVKESALEDYIGKEAAKKLLEQPKQGTLRSLTGVDLKVGGEGMKAFYDKIVPNVANDILKKLGGGRVGEIKTDATDYGKSGRTEEKSKYAVYGSQPGFDITPELKAKVEGGLPLFQGDNVHRAGYSPETRLIRTFETANESSILHELGHHFLENLKFYAAVENAPRRVKERWEIARREFAIGESGEISTASHELMARSFERYLADGTAPSPQLRSMFERFKEWMLKVYTDLKNIGEVRFNPQVRKMFDMMLATDEQMRAARELNIPRAYVPEAKADLGRKLVPGFKDEQLAMFPFAEELAIGPGSGKTNDSRVNAQYINGPMDFKLAIEQVSRIDQQNIQQARGGATKTWEAANAEVDRIARDALGGDVSALNLFRGDPNAPSHDIQQRGAFRVMMAIAKHSLQLREAILEKGADATVREQFDYLNSIVRMRMAHAEFLGLRAASARALNQIRDMTPESGAVGKMVEATMGRELFQTVKTEAERAGELEVALRKIMDTHFGGRSALDIAKLQGDIKSLKGQLVFAKAVTDATKWEMVIEGWKSGILSGPITHVTNVGGTGAFQMLRPIVDTIAAGIGMMRGARVGMGEGDRASALEGLARISNWLKGTEEGLRLGYHVFKADEASMKTESYREAIPGFWGRLIRIPLRGMGAGDAVLSTMYYRAELGTLAWRNAIGEGFRPGTREFGERVSFWKDNPTPEMVKTAEAEATRMTFNMDLGVKGASVQRMVKVNHLELLAPFIRTPINIFKEVARLSPFSPLVGEWRAAMEKGGVARDRAVAELVLGTGIMALAIGYFFDGTLSGSGSPDPGKNRAKAGVWQPGSILIGDTWYEIQRIQPLGTLLVLAADMANVWDHMTEEESDKVPKLVAMAFANSVTNQTFLQGITNVVQALAEPDRKMAQLGKQFAGSLVPNIIGQTVTLSDPYVREANSMLEAIQARLPGLREDLPAKRDWTGEEEKTKSRLGVVSPIRTTTVSEDKVRTEAARLDLSIAGPPKRLHVGKGTGKLGDVELTPEERNKFTEVSGKMAHDLLSNVVNSPGWEMPEATKLQRDLAQRKIFQNLLSKSRQYAAIITLPPEKREAVMQSFERKVTAE